MDGIGSFLRKYLDFTPPELSTIRAVTFALQQVLGVEVAESDISLRSGIVYVNLSGTYKSELIFKKKEVLRVAEEKLGSAIKDIR